MTFFGQEQASGDSNTGSSRERTILEQSVWHFLLGTFGNLFFDRKLDVAFEGRSARVWCGGNLRLIFRVVFVFWRQSGLEGVFLFVPVSLIWTWATLHFGFEWQTHLDDDAGLLIWEATMSQEKRRGDWETLWFFVLLIRATWGYIYIYRDIYIYISFSQFLTSTEGLGSEFSFFLKMGEHEPLFSHSGSRSSAYQWKKWIHFNHLACWGEGGCKKPKISSHPKKRVDLGRFLSKRSHVEIYFLRAWICIGLKQNKMLKMFTLWQEKGGGLCSLKLWKVSVWKWTQTEHPPLDGKGDLISQYFFWDWSFPSSERIITNLGEHNEKKVGLKSVGGCVAGGAFVSPSPPLPLFFL